MSSIKKDNKSESKNPSPPWIKYPGKAPYWGGWRQGESEHWLLHIWLPFWRKLTEAEQQIFLQNHPPPDAEWRDYILQHWR